MELKASENMSMIFITHNLRVVKEISDEVCVMQNGEIVEKGSTKKIFSNPKSDYTKKLLNSLPKGFKKIVDKFEKLELRYRPLINRYPCREDQKFHLKLGSSKSLCTYKFRS